MADPLAALPDALADAVGGRAVAAMDLSDAAAAAAAAATNARAAAAGLPPISTASARGAAPPPRATHECDACGVGGATRSCGGCRSVYYCGPGCQRRDWRVGGHRGACGAAAAAAAAVGAAAVATLADPSLPPARRGDASVYAGLDASGPFAAAVGAGLWPALRAALAEDAASVGARFAGGHPDEALSFAHHAMGLFRGGRRSTGPAAGGFGSADGGRAAAYFGHHPDAWGGWLAAAAALTRAALTPPVCRRPAVHAVAHRAARDVWSVTTLMVARRECARVVLFGGGEPQSGGGGGEGGGGGGEDGGGGGGGDGGGGEEDGPTRLVQSRMRTSMEQLTAVMGVAEAASEAADPGSVVDALVNQTVAQLVDWAGLMAPAVDVRGMLRLRGGRRQLYERVAVPLGVATNRKGATLSSAEARVVLQGRRA